MEVLKYVLLKYDDNKMSIVIEFTTFAEKCNDLYNV